MPWPIRIGFAAPQLVQQRDHQPCAGRAQRMSQRNRPAIDIHLIAIQAKLFFDRQVLPGKSLVYFDQVDFVQLQPGFFERRA